MNSVARSEKNRWRKQVGRRGSQSKSEDAGPFARQTREGHISEVGHRGSETRRRRGHCNAHRGRVLAGNEQAAEKVFCCLLPLYSHLINAHVADSLSNAHLADSLARLQFVSPSELGSAGAPPSVLGSTSFRLVLCNLLRKRERTEERGGLYRRVRQGCTCERRFFPHPAKTAQLPPSLATFHAIISHERPKMYESDGRLNNCVHHVRR
jgi:hypothetical protein